MSFLNRFFNDVADFLESTFSNYREDKEDREEKEVYVGQIFVHRVNDVKDKLFNSNEKPNKVYDFLEETVPLHVNYDVDTKVGFFTLTKKVNRVGNYYYDNELTLREHFDIPNLNNLCKFAFTREQEERYQKLIVQNPIIN
jgi:hypothetical protein